MALNFRPYPVQQKRDKWGEVNRTLQSIIPLLSRAIQFSQNKTALAEREKLAGEDRDYTLEQRRVRAEDRATGLEDKKVKRQRDTMRFKQWQADQNKPQKPPGETPWEKSQRSIATGRVKTFEGIDPGQRPEYLESLGPEPFRAAGFNVSQKAPTIQDPNWWDQIKSFGTAQPRYVPGAPVLRESPRRDPQQGPQQAGGMPSAFKPTPGNLQWWNSLSPEAQNQARLKYGQ